MFSCRKWIDQYVECQQRPGAYIEFLKASTEMQKRVVPFNFEQNRGYYDRHI